MEKFKRFLIVGEKMKELQETHQAGFLSLENAETLFPDGIKSKVCDVGLQVAKDGRIWLCVNGVAFIRFSPHPNKKMHSEKPEKEESSLESGGR